MSDFRHLIGEKLMILGSRGFLGKALLAEVERLDPDAVTWIAPQFDLRGNRLDFSEKETFFEILSQEKPRIILNLIGRTHGSIEDFHRDNVLPVLNLIEWVSTCSPRTEIVSVGSAAEYGKVGTEPVTEDKPSDPISPYGASKWKATQLLLEAKAKVARPSNIVGAGVSQLGLVGSLIHQMVSNSTALSMRALHPVRDYIHVKDAAIALLHLCNPSVTPGIYNVSTGIGASNEEVAQLLCEISGQNLPLVADSFEDSGVDIFLADPSKLIHATGFAPRRSLQSALEDAWRSR